MITLTLSRSEALLLFQAVETKLSLVMNELVHADNREFREDVRQLATSLEQLQRKLSKLTGTEPAHAS